MSNSIKKALPSSLSLKIRRGFSWNALNLILNKGTSIVVRLLLARLLVPGDFGLIAMIIVFLGLMNIFVDFGLKNALIQHKHDDIDRNDSAFLFFLSGGVFWAILFVLAGIPLLTWFYDQPNLSIIAMVMGASIILNGLTIVPEVRLTRGMSFKPLVIAEAVGTVIASVVAISMAYAGAGIWALVAQQLISVSFRSILIWYFAGWYPRWYFSWRSLRDLMGFSGWMLGNQVVHYLRKNMDKVLIGYLLGAASLGIYSLAFMITETMRTQISTIVGQVMFPAYSKLQDDRAEIKRLYLKVILYTTLLVFPISILFILYSEPLILMLFGEEWIAAASPVRILAFASMIFALSGDPSSVLRGLGKPNLAFHISLWNTTIVGLPTLLAGAFYYGIDGAAWAVVIHYSTSRIANQYFLRRELDLRGLSIIYNALPALITSATIVFIDWCIF